MDPVISFDLLFKEHLAELLEASNPSAPNIAVPVVLPPSDNIQTGRHGWWWSTGAAPPVLQLLAPVMAAPNGSQTDQNREAGTFSQVQITQYEWPAKIFLPAAHVIPNTQYQWRAYNGPSFAGMKTPPAADPCNNVPRISLPKHLTKGLQPARSLVCQNRETVCTLPPAAPQTKTNNSIKREPDDQEQWIVKKPLNAFMLFLKEQRLMMTAKHKGSGSACVNKILGEKWKLMSKEQKTKYYDQAKREAELHAERHPGFSCKKNYGKKKKRMRATNNDYHLIQHPKELLVWPAESVPSPLPGPVMEFPHPSTRQTHCP